jgi:hypothetical protein
MAIGDVVQSYFIRNDKRADLLFSPELSGGTDIAINYQFLARELHTWDKIRSFLLNRI